MIIDNEVVRCQGVGPGIHNVTPLKKLQRQKKTDICGDYIVGHAKSAGLLES